MHFPLIQGTEVAIAFHEGDPDRPYIAHALHDSRHQDHVTDKNNTRNVIRTPANNKLRMEDKRGQEHIKLSTEYGGKSQLNLGHLVDDKRQPRGDGFELRTDSWGAIRAGKGLFISTDKQEKASGKVLAMEEAIAQLEQALSIAKNLSKVAEISGSANSDINAQEMLKENLSNLAAPGLLVHAPDGIGIFTPKPMSLGSGQESIAISALKAINLSANKTITINAEKDANIFAEHNGIKMFAKYGDVKIEAQNDAMSLLSKQDLNIQSIDGKVHITAGKEIIINCGGAYIKLSEGNIELGCPNNILFKTTNIQKMGSADYHSPSPEITKGFSEQFTLKDEKTNKILPYTNYTITTEDGEVFKGMSDAQGKTLDIVTSIPQKLSIVTHRDDNPTEVEE